MICIERDYNDYAVRSKEPGFGRGFRVGKLSMRLALIAVKHYYGVNHDAGLCGHCKERPKRIGGLCQCARGSVLPNACIDRLRNTGKHKEAA